MGASVSASAPSPFNDNYEFVKKLGQGGFGTVALMKKKSTGGNVAVKILTLNDNSDIKYAQRELDNLLKLKHPNIVLIHTGWNEPAGVTYPPSLKLGNDKKYFIEMEFCTENSLQSALPTIGGEIAKVKPIFRDVLEGLVFIHGKGVMHRDLKPDNILLAKVNGIVVAKLGDLGLARTIEMSKPSYNPYMTNAGTLAYWSPEQATNKIYDTKTDIYPLGLIFLAMLDKGFDRFCTFTEEGYTKIFIPARDIIMSKFPNEAKLIVQMMAISPSGRPSSLTLREWVKNNYKI